MLYFVLQKGSDPHDADGAALEEEAEEEFLLLDDIITEVWGCEQTAKVSAVNASLPFVDCPRALDQ